MTLLLERGDIPGFKVGRRRRRHEKRGGAWVRGHRVSGLVQRPSSGALRGFIAQRPLKRSVGHRRYTTNLNVCREQMLLPTLVGVAIARKIQFDRRAER